MSPTTAAPPKPLLPDVPSLWMLDPEIHFMNHGSFGARPRAVWSAQQRLREAFEASPIEFLARRFGGLLETTKRELGTFLGMEPGDFGLTTNVTEAICSVLLALELGPGDEVISSDHLYNAVRQGLRHWVGRRGAEVREIAIPLPCASPRAVEDAFADALCERTRLVVVDHVTSPTALRFPVERIAALCRERGVPILVDGAHAPGMLDLDVGAVGADYYAANLHKWLCAPPGCGMLWVRRELQSAVHPAAVSHGYESGLAREFEWQGTRDPSAWLAIGDAIATQDTMFGPKSWPRIRAHNHALATWVQSHLCERWQVEPISPEDGSMLGSMTSVSLPEATHRCFEHPAELQQRLFDAYRIEVPCFRWNDRWLTRPCCNVYNRAEQYACLGDAVLELLG